MFPELRGALSKAFTRFGPDAPLTLDLVRKDIDNEQVSDSWYAASGYFRTLGALQRGAPSWAGERVSEQTAQNLSVVHACRRIICETVASIPCQLMQRSKDGKTTRQAIEKPLHKALTLLPNPEMVAQSYVEAVSNHMLMHGTAFSSIIRRSGTGEAIGLYPIHPGRVRRDRDQKGKLVWLVDKDRSYTVEPNKPQDLLTIPGLGNDGILGFSVLEMARQSLGTAIAAERNVALFYEHGGRLPYILNLDQRWATDEDRKKFAHLWKNEYNNPHEVPMLPPNIKWQQVGLSLKDQQLLESRQFNVSEICRWFGVQPHLVFDLSRATNNNIEQMALEFEKFTLRPWLNRWQQNLYRCVLTPEEQSAGFEFRHNANALLSAEFATRMAGYASGLQNGWLNQDEVRLLEDMDPIPEGAGQAYHLQLNMQTLPGTGEPLSPPKNPEAAPRGVGDSPNPASKQLHVVA